jgi:RNase P/RNase MRP subunit POP5
LIITTLESNTGSFDSNAADVWLSSNTHKIEELIITTLESNTGLFDSNAADVWLSSNTNKIEELIITTLESNTGSFDSNAADVWLSEKGFVSSTDIVSLIGSNTGSFDSNAADVWLSSNTNKIEELIISTLESNTGAFDSNTADVWLLEKGLLSSTDVISLIGSNTGVFDSNAADVWLSSNTNKIEELIITTLESNTGLFDSNTADVWLSEKGFVISTDIVSLIESTTGLFDSNNADVWLSNKELISSNQMADFIQDSLLSDVYEEHFNNLMYGDMFEDNVINVLNSNNIFDSNAATTWFTCNITDGGIILFDEGAATTWFVDKVVEGDFVLFDEGAANTWFVDNVASGYYVLFDGDAATSWFIDQVHHRNFILFDEIAANEWHQRLIGDGHVVLFDCNAANDWLKSNVDSGDLILFDSNAADDWLLTKEIFNSNSANDWLQDLIYTETLILFDSNAADDWLLTKDVFNSNAANEWFSNKLIYAATGDCKYEDADNIIDGPTYIDGDLIVHGKICALSFPVVFDSNAASSWFEDHVDSGTYVLFDSNAANVWWKDKLLLNGMCAFDSNHDPDNEIIGTTVIDGDLIVKGKLCMESIPVLFDSNAATGWFGDLLSNSLIITQPSSICSNFDPLNVIKGDSEIIGDLRVTGKICGDLLIYAPPIFDNVSMKSISIDETWDFTIESNTSNLLIGKNSNTSLTITDAGTDIHGILSIENYWKQYLDTSSNLIFESRNGVLIEFNEIWKADVLNFTGKHRCYSDIRNPKIGQIVYSKGKYMNLEDSSEITIDEALPVVSLTRKAFDARVLGVIGGVDTVGEYQIGNIKFSKPLLSKRLIVQSHGEGGIIVCNINGNLKNGDFITSSSIVGYGMRQKSKLRYTHTIAKITCDCFFTGRNVFDAVHKGNKYKACLVGCFYV